MPAGFTKKNMYQTLTHSTRAKTKPYNINTLSLLVLVQNTVCGKETGFTRILFFMIVFRLTFINKEISLILHHSVCPVKVSVFFS
jgi:hypothetical protein